MKIIDVSVCIHCNKKGIQPSYYCDETNKSYCWDNIKHWIKCLNCNTDHEKLLLCEMDCDWDLNRSTNECDPYCNCNCKFQTVGINYYEPYDG